MKDRKINPEKLDKLLNELKLIANGDIMLTLMIDEFEYVLENSSWDNENKIKNVHHFISIFYCSMEIERHESLANIALNLITE